MLIGVDLSLELRREFKGIIGFALLTLLEGRGHTLVVCEFSLIVAGKLLSASLHPI